jgi:hypothetical protein
MKKPISKAKQNLIKKIKDLIDKNDGTVTTGDMQAESSPCYSSAGNKVCSLVEQFHSKSVTVITYVRDREEDEFDVSYEQLSVSVLKEIHELVKEYVDNKEEE